MEWITNPDFSLNVAVIVFSFTFFHFIATPLVRYFSVDTDLYKQLSPEFKIQWCSRGVSTIHAVISTVLSFYVLAVDDVTYQDPLWGKSLLGELTVAFTYGYMLADLVYLVMELSPKTSDVYYASIVHHFMFIICEPILLVSGAMTHFALVRLFAEVSTPFVNFRWSLAASNKKETRIYFYNGLMLVFTFFFSRILMLPYVYLRLLGPSDSEGMHRLGFRKIILVGPAIVDVLNIFWFYRIVKGIIKHFKPLGDETKSD